MTIHCMISLFRKSYGLFLILFLLQNKSYSSEYLDPNIVPDLENKLKFLNKKNYKEHLIDRNFERPKKCPIRSSIKLLEIHKKLLAVTGALKYGECYNRNKDLVDGFEKIVNEQSNFVSTVNHRNTTSTKQENSSQSNSIDPMQSQKQMFNALGEIAHDDDCLLNVKQRGLLPVVADVATNVGQVASMMPTPNGFLIGAGGITIGATLKIINGLFQSPFNWELASDRKQFQDLNCTFFDLRRDIESAEIVDIRDDSIDEKLAEIKDLKLDLDKKLQQNYQNQKNMKNNVFKEEMAFVEVETKKETVELMHKISILISLIEENNSKVSTEDIDYDSEKIKNIQLFMNSYPEMIRYIEARKNNPPYTTYMLDLMREFKWSDLKQYNSLSTKNFSNEFQKPLAHYLQEYLKYLENITEAARKRFYSKKNNSSNKQTNEVILKKANINYEAISAKIIETSQRLENRRQIILLKDRKRPFDPFDDGAHATYDVLEEYRNIQGLIYGKLGYTYMKYFRSQLFSLHQEFLSYYSKFNRKYYSRKGKFKQKEIKWACRDINQMRVIWESANSAGEVANDFIDTNIGIFHSKVKKLRTFFFFIPIGYSREYQIYRNVRSAELAKSIIKGDENYNRKKMRHYGHRHQQNLGELMLDISFNEEKRVEIEDFMEQYSCLTYL